MGVPKFFRYISERYPCLSESVKEYQIPEFDNLYLDMNGIIHNCSHPDDGNPHFRITEEKIFADIFHYIEILFQMIKPQKVFFMAIDGVAPRAKMNQQRGRRFRSAKDAQKLEDEAIEKGEKLPEEARFDSNCITPGTEFMARLHEQLKYFVVKKVSQNPLWQRCQIILSGHETPGEGEHKIMDFIRYKRSQPDYDPNTRHCLYGLDADLIMLGLCTHDPHFSLLREEVKFGKKANSKRTCVPEEIKFFLLHLSLMREYLEMEFGSLKTSLKSFEFDIEKIIDDWVLMGFLVGNDFIPNLPNLHIAGGALPVLYSAYIETLPTLDGYINEGGKLNLKRFEIFMKKLGEIDVQNFEETRDDLLYMESKTGRKMKYFSKADARPQYLQAWKPEENDEVLKPELDGPLEPENNVKDSGLAALIAATEDEYAEEEEEDSNSEEDDDEEFRNFKKNYYISKLEYTKVTPEVMRSQAEGYVRAIQWNLHYYYNGVCSWSWYYPHHYSPYVSDIKNFQDLNLDFDLGKPFMPYEQLLAVLPAASKNLLPSCYHSLMTDEDSPIKKYYPENFNTDLNGKRQDWEAVVLIPFIDENTLLEAMKTCADKLTPSEFERNKHGPMLSYTYTEDDLGAYDAPEYFPKISHNHAKLQPITIDEIRVPVEKLVKGAYPGVLMDVYYPGFPTFKYLKYESRLKKAQVKVFEQNSRGESMVVSVIPSEKSLQSTLPVELLGKTVFVGWPHLAEAKVVALMNNKEKYSFVSYGAQPAIGPSPPTYKLEVENVTSHYKGRLGIEYGEVSVLVKVQTMSGQKYMITPNGRISLEKTFYEDTSNYPLQLIVENINVYAESREISPTLEKLFPANSTCFLLTPDKYYGCRAIVKKDEKTPDDKVCVNVTLSDEPNLSKVKKSSEDANLKYKTAHSCAYQLRISNYMFSRITGSYFVSARTREGGLKTINLGLDLKFNKKNLEIPGFTKKIDGVWYYTDAAIDLVGDYMDEFPEIFDHLADDQNKEQITAEELFPEETEIKVKAVKTWLNAQAHSKVPKRKCDTAVVEKEIVEELEKIIDSFKPSKSSETLIFAKPNLLYKSDLCFGNLKPDSNVEVQLFDRIVNVRGNHTVPLGLRGTIIGILKAAEDSQEEMYEILFDKTFEGGIEINCTLGRGYRLPLNAFINISHGIRMYQPQTAAQARKDEYVQRKFHNYNSQNNKNSSNINLPHSAFAKFSNNHPSPSYNAVPPFMPNGDPIYKSYDQQSRQFYNYSQSHQKYQNYNSPKGEQNAFDVFKNQFMRQSNHNVNNFNKNEARPKQQFGNDLNRPKNNQNKTDFMPVFKRTPDQEVEDTADVLKRLLNISTNEDKGQNSKSATVSKRNDKPKPKQNIKQPNSEPKQGFQPSASTKPKNVTKPADTSNTLATVQLLSYYQSKSLGLPRYQYITSELGTQCQIKLPNGTIIIGKPATTREEASEIVAESALGALNLKKEMPLNAETKEIKDSPRKIPIPPKQWWNNEAKALKQETKTYSSKNNAWKGMIPLQAVKKEKANSSSKTKTVKENNADSNKKNTKLVLGEKADPSNSNDKAQFIEKKEEKPKRRPRKMRIAANFGNPEQ